MNSIVEVIYARRPLINYIAPAACEPPIASTGIALLSIFLPDLFTRIRPTGKPVIYGTYPGPFFIDWETTPGAICYNIYQLIGDQYVLIYECVDKGPIVITDPGCYAVTPITPEGEGPPSEVECTGTPENPESPGGGELPEPPLGGNFGPCEGGWSLFSTALTPDQVTSWFGGNTVFSPGTYKIVVRTDSNFTGEPPCVGVQFPENYTAEWNDGTNSSLNPYNSDFTCYATAEDMFAATPPPYDFEFVHTGGKIGVNPNGNNKLTFNLYLQCGGGGEEPPSESCEETGDDTTCAYGATGAKYRIVDYSESNFDISICGLSWTNCINCEIHPDVNCVGPVPWSGTFPVKVDDGWFIEQEFEPDPSCGDCFPSSCPGCVTPPPHSLHGFCIGASLRTSSAPNSTGCGWAISIFGYLGENIWTGIKNKGEGPVGIYQRVSGCCPGPECMTIEAY